MDPTVLAALDGASRIFFALSLDLDRDYFSTLYTANPTVLFRIFHYPSVKGEAWGVGEHTDYGLLTLLA